MKYQFILSSIISFLSVLFFISCGEEPVSENKPYLSEEQLNEIQQAAVASLTPYNHSLQGVTLIDGKVPGVDIHDSLTGKRYAVVTGISVDENGNTTSMPPIIELEKKTLSIQEREDIRQQKLIENGGVEREIVYNTAKKIGEPLQKAIDTASDTDTFHVLIRLQEPDDDTLVTKLERAVGLGEIQTREDYFAKRKEFIEQKQLEIETAQTVVIDEIRGIGGSITYRCKNMYCLSAFLNKTEIFLIQKNSIVLRLDVDGTNENNDHVIYGNEILEGSQLDQLIDDGHDGEYGSDIYFAMAEMDGYNDEHVGFNESSSGSSRIAGRYECDSNGCTSTSNFGTTTSNHGTKVAGLIFGDLRDGQDPNKTTLASQIQLSGYAGEARGYLYELNTSDAAEIAAMDHAVQISTNPPHIYNQSIGDDSNDTLCEGETNESFSANDLYENGILMFFASGNNGHSSSTDCTVENPGAAIGVFTVGAHGDGIYDAVDGDGHKDVRNDAIASYSDRGGQLNTNAEGKGRSIIDLTLYGCRYGMFDDDASNDYETSVDENEVCGTSFTAPTVSAAAIDLIDLWKTHYDNNIDNPGYLYANMLLMGDREGWNGTNLIAEYDNLFGAGRLKMRMWHSTTGLDSPAAWSSGSTCVEDNETVTITINNGSTLSSDVEIFKAVIFWYDRRHESGTTIDDIDLRLKKTDNTLLQSSTDAHDNKERVYYSGVGGNAVKLEIYGYGVTADNEGCGTNSMKVYWTYLYEDSDRDDADGPSWNSSTQFGVQPE